MDIYFLNLVFPLVAAVAALQNPPNPTSPAPRPAAQELAECLRLIRGKEFPAARVRLERLVVDHPTWARAEFMLGLTYHEEQRYGLAKRYFARAVALDPRDLAFRPFYGWCLYYLGEAAAAREQFEAYLEAKPDYSDAHFAIGLIEYEADDLEAAAARFRRTIELAIATKDARVEGKARARMGDIHIRRNELEKARDELLKAVKLRDDAYEAYFKLSRVFERLGDKSKAKWAREMHKSIYEKMHPTPPPPMGGPASQPARVSP
ncbi:MAG TPA: tetratricopeptide repeat protein [Phycisphaerae bacterium]|nr:tetratricopeptide repeat protein [Phycisphaerae bacterium]